jgi:hypothetical protein
LPAICHCRACPHSRANVASPRVIPMACAIMWCRVLVERACVKVMVLPAPTSPPELKTETELLT